uniref:Cytochrome P450 n=1 Tax=Ailuropoda melanoleuca TaxID=9646 RepID=A0A7N5KCS4_AILME
MGLLTRDLLGPLAIALAVFLLLLDLMQRRGCWAARYPPGPTPLPLLGNLLQMDFQNTLGYFDQLRHRFGNVFSLQLAWTPVVVLNGLDAVREALVCHSEDTADRPPMPIYEHLGFGPHSQGVILARYGREWREQRRFSLSMLRNFGLGKRSLEQWVAEEASCLCEAFADHAGRPFSPRALVDKAVSNVISSLTFGRRFEYDDPRFLKLLDRLQAGVEEDQGFLHEFLNSVPVLLRIPGLASKVFSAQKALMALTDELIQECRMTWDPTQPPRDLTDAFLNQIEKVRAARTWAQCPQESGRGRSPDPRLLATVGMPVCPGRVQQEIDEVIGRVQQPEMGNQTRMPFTMAVVHEVQRFGDIVPLGLPHMTSRDTEVQGFLIPKGTRIIANLSSVLKDEKIWKKPFRFYPEHFLDAQGRFVKQEAFMPFSAGRRVCLGEPLARMELLLFFAWLLQRFGFSVPAGQPAQRPRSLLLPGGPSPLPALCRASLDGGSTPPAGSSGGLVGNKPVGWLHPGF